MNIFERDHELGEEMFAFKYEHSPNSRIAPNSPSPGVTVAFIEDNGEPVEFLQIDRR